MLDSAKGWAAVLKFNGALWKMFQAFRARDEDFDLACVSSHLCREFGYYDAWTKQRLTVVPRRSSWRPSTGTRR